MSRFSFVFLLVMMAGCASVEDTSKTKPKDLYAQGLSLLKEHNYKDASKRFLDIDRFHPNDPLASPAQLLSGYASFMAREYNDGIDIFSVFVRLDPTTPHAAYAHYMIGMCYYAQTQHIERDHGVIEKAGRAFEELIENFPHTVYAKDAKLKMDFIRAHLAAKEMMVGRYYQSENNCIAAMQRFNEVIKHFSKSPHAPEALYRLIECQLSLGLKDEAVTTLKVISLNFPKSIWCEKAKGAMTQ